MLRKNFQVSMFTLSLLCMYSDLEMYCNVINVKTNTMLQLCFTKNSHPCFSLFIISPLISFSLLKLWTQTQTCFYYILPQVKWKLSHPLLNKTQKRRENYFKDFSVTENIFFKVFSKIETEMMLNVVYTYTH